MRIALIAPLVSAIREPHLGGAQTLLADIATGLTVRGHDVSVFAASGSEIVGVRTVDVGVDPAALSSTLFRAGDAAAESSAAYDAFGRVYERVRTESFDVVHNHAFDAPAIELADVAAPVVHTMHLPPSARMVRTIDDVRARTNLTIACVSESSARRWRSVTSVDVVLRNGIRVDSIPWRSGAGEGVVFAGRFSPEKGAAHAIDIARQAGQRLTLVGSPYDEAYFRRSIEPHRDAVNIVETLPRQQLWELMSRSTAVLCPVQWDEPFGLIAAESAAAGTPVVAFARGALPEIVVDGRTGYLAEDIRGAVDALRAIGDIDRTACRWHAEQALSIEQTLDAHEDFYRSMCK